MRPEPIFNSMPVPPKTVDDYFALDDPECRIELIDGEFVMSPGPEMRHQAAVVQLTMILQRQVIALNLGWVFVAPFDTILSPTSVVHPDVLFVAKANYPRLGKLLDGSPDLAVEFLSPSNPEYDLKRKKQLYLKSGVPWYWIGDPEARTIHVLENGGTDWIDRGVFRIEDTIRPAGMPGVVVEVREVYLRPV